MRDNFTASKRETPSLVLKSRDADRAKAASGDVVSGEIAEGDQAARDLMKDLQGKGNWIGHSGTKTGFAYGD